MSTKGPSMRYGNTRGTTFKYDPRDGTLVEVTKDGYVISYRHTGKKFTYVNKKGKEKTVWIKH